MPIDALDKLPRASETTSVADAYRAMLRLMEYYFKVDHEYPIGGILGDVSPGVWANGSPGDPAAWPLWLDSVDNKKDGEAVKS
jgi:hypothetical protein